MKKLNLLAFTSILACIFIFASICGAEIRNTTIVQIQAGDTIHGYIVKYYPGIKPSKKAYRALADFNGIGDYNTIIAGREFLIPADLGIEAETKKEETVKIETLERNIALQDSHLFEHKTKARHTVKQGETISYLVKRYYDKRPALAFCRALARYNDINTETFRIFAGQTILIPNVLVLEQRVVGVNPTTVGNKKAVELAITQTNQSAKEAGINLAVAENEASGIVEKIKKSQKKFKLNGQLAAAATFGQGVQGWTRIKTRQELSGGYTSVRSGKYKIDFVIADQCDNAYSLIFRQKDLLLLPPSRAMLPLIRQPLPTAGKAEIKPGIEYRVEYLPELNNVDGYFHDVPVTGGYVDGYWTTTELWLDSYGNWTNGISYLTRDWHGESGDPTPYKFDGSVRMWAAQTRWTDESWQFIARIGAGDRKDSGGFTNEWVSYDSKGSSELYNLYLSSEYRDYNKKWFSKFRLANEYEWANSSTQTRSDYMHSYWDNKTTLMDVDPENQNTFWSILTTDIYSFDEERNFLIVGENGFGYQWNHDNKSLSLKGGVQLFGGLKVLVGYTWNSADIVADTKNIPSLELYPYGLYKGIKRHLAKEDIVEADDEMEAEKRISNYEDRMNRLLEKKILKR